MFLDDEKTITIAATSKLADKELRRRVDPPHHMPSVFQDGYELGWDNACDEMCYMLTHLDESIKAMRENENEYR